MSSIEPHIASLLGRRTSRNVNVLHDEEAKTLGQRMADHLASGAGSWAFIISFLGFIAVWMAINAVAWIRHWDPYPFILLNLILSCVAAIQAPIILMSQNREEARDRIRAQADYEVNLKAELLLEHLTQEVEALKVMIIAIQSSATDAPSAGPASDGAALPEGGL